VKEDVSKPEKRQESKKEVQMPFLLIKGTFKPGTGMPDGDTVRFAPDNPNLLFQLRQRGFPPKLNENNGTIALRYEGIDALEKEVRHPESANATAKNLELLGLSGPQDEGRGYVFSRQLGPHGRPICVVFSGDTNEPDGDSVFVTAERITSSVNHQLLENGNAYPLFYDTLFHDLRAELTQAVKSARQADKGVWLEDATNTGITWGGASSLGGLPPIFPKLWRRLEDYTFDRDFRDVSDTLDAFPEYLEQRGDRVLVLPETHFTGFDNVVEIDGNTLKLKFKPEELVFKS
jgi:endonuclease YncB( thermonuclease family)